MKRSLFCTFIYFIFLTSCLAQSIGEWKERGEWKAYFEAYQVEGTFLLYNEGTGLWQVYNQERALTSYLPASTFKILNSLLAFEYGVIENPETLLHWDGISRWNANWNKDLSVQEAFAVSCVPCYQEIARTIGLQRMRQGVQKAGWGQMDIQPHNLDSFWLMGNSRISPLEQIQFLRRLQHNSLPFSLESQQKLKTIMLVPHTGPAKVLAKTGITQQGDRYIGWYVGIVKTADTTYYFALNLQTPATGDYNPILEARLAIPEQILSELKIF